jgi:hypothetical protein
MVTREGEEEMEAAFGALSRASPLLLSECSLEAGTD